MILASDNYHTNTDNRAETIFHRPTIMEKNDYTPIAFDERVTFWLQRARIVRALHCACMFAALYACAIA